MKNKLFALGLLAVIGLGIGAGFGASYGDIVTHYLTCSTLTVSGDASANSHIFTGDTNTGISHPGADTVGVLAGGAVTAKFGTDSVTFTGNVGIGTTAPASLNSRERVFEVSSGGTTETPGIVMRAGSGYTTNPAWEMMIGATSATETNWSLRTGTTPVITASHDGRVGIGTTAPASPLAVNRQANDGVIIDLEQADTVEGTISVSGNTVSYNAFAGSHYTQLKDGQSEPPIGAVVVSTGEIIPCKKTVTDKTEVTRNEATNVIDKTDAVEEVDEQVDDKDVGTEEVTQIYDVATDSIRSETKTTYAKKTIKKKKIKDGVEFHNGKFLRLKKDIKKENDKYFRVEKRSEAVTNKEYFVYVDTTSVAADKRVYGTWMGKMANNAEGMSFGQKNKPVYLVTQVGLFKIRVTDTNGNISNGDYLETSSRAMEAQRQTVPEKRNSTIAKSLVDVDWSKITVDANLGYKWLLIPGTY